VHDRCQSGVRRSPTRKHSILDAFFDPRCPGERSRPVATVNVIDSSCRATAVGKTRPAPHGPRGQAALPGTSALKRTRLLYSISREGSGERARSQRTSTLERQERHLRVQVRARADPDALPSPRGENRFRPGRPRWQRTGAPYQALTSRAGATAPGGGGVKQIDVSMASDIPGDSNAPRGRAGRWIQAPWMNRGFVSCGAVAPPYPRGACSLRRGLRHSAPGSPGRPASRPRSPCRRTRTRRQRHRYW